MLLQVGVEQELQETLRNQKQLFWKLETATTRTHCRMHTLSGELFRCARGFVRESLYICSHALHAITLHWSFGDQYACGSLIILDAFQPDRMLLLDNVGHLQFAMWSALWIALSALLPIWIRRWSSSSWILSL
jgi:hypothetical protein